MTMKHLIIYGSALLMTLLGINHASAEGPEGYRTRLIPYPTANEAANHSMAKNRYMQPIVEWQEGDDSTLSGEFTYPFSWVERQVFVRIEGMTTPYEVLINGKRAGESSNGYVATEFNITKLAREDKNTIILRLLPNKDVMPIECFEKSNATPVAYVLSQPRVRMRDVFYNTTLGKNSVVNINVGTIMHNETLGAKTSRIYYELYLNDTIRLTGGHRDVSVGMYGIDTMRFGAPIPDSTLWSSSCPTRLSLRLKNRIAGRDIEFYDIALAARELHFEDDTFYINGQATSISWLEVSPNISNEELVRLHDAGHTALRFTAGYVSDELLEMCDARGIYVAVTAPINSSTMGSSRKRGGNPSNNPRWRKEYIERVTHMIYTTQRHPSVIAYYLADDSANGICLYEAYLAAKDIPHGRPVFYDDGNGEWNSDR